MSRIRSQYYITRSRKAGDENEVSSVVAGGGEDTADRHISSWSVNLCYQRYF